MGSEEQIKKIEAELDRMQYNKATEKWFGQQKAKLAKLKEEVEESKKSKKGQGFGTKKRGHSTVIMVGFPSVGKIVSFVSPNPNVASDK